MQRPLVLILATILTVASGCLPQSEHLTIALSLLPSELPVYRSVLDEFEKESGLRVVVVPQQYADIRRALAAEAVAGTGSLDLVELDVYGLTLSARDVSPLKRSELQPELDELLPKVLEAGHVQGLRFIPHRVAWQALIYNHKEIGEPPDSWDDLLAVARRYPQRIALKGALYEGLTCDILPFVWAAGGDGVRLDSPGAKEAFAFLRQLAPYLHPQSETFKESTIAEAMARGEIVLHLNWPFVMSLYHTQGLAPGTIRSAPLPRGPRGRATVLGGGYLAVPRSTARREDAVHLARFLIGSHAQQRFARDLGWFSPRTDIPPADPHGLLGGFLAMREQVRPRPERADYPLLSRLWQESFRAIVFGGQDPSSTLTAAQRQLSTHK